MSTASSAKGGAKPANNPNPRQRQMLIIMGAVIAVALVAIVAVIALSGTSAAEVDYAALEQTELSDGTIVIGDPNAPITIVEFADFACPHCQTYYPTMQRIISEYVTTGQAKFEFRLFPTAGGQQTVFAGQLLDCAEQLQPGSFWRGYDLMWDYINRGIYFSNDLGSTFARDIGVSYSELLNCTSESTRVTTDVALGQNLGVTGTPALAVRYNDGQLQWLGAERGGPGYATIAAAIEQANS